MGRGGRGNCRSQMSLRSFVLSSTVVSLLASVQNAQAMQIRRATASEFYNGCVDDLAQADDGDLKLNSTEFLTFIGLRSDGRLTYSNYSDLPLSLVSNFNFGACFCALISQDDQCCVGDQAGVTLDPSVSDLVEDNLFTFCLSTEASISALLPDTPSPTRAPQTATPTASPSSTPTVSETSATAPPVGTDAPIPSPSLTPTSSPTEPSFRPTSENEVCINFQYGIINNGGVDAEAIYNEEGNTLKTGLIIATANVTIETLNATFPDRLLRSRQPESNENQITDYGQESTKYMDPRHLIVPLEFFGSHLPVGAEIQDSTPSNRRLAYITQSWYSSSSQLTRRLVFYDDSVPPEIRAIIDNPFCPTETPQVTKCAIVTSTVCVFLEDGDDPDVVKAQLRRGIQASIANGDFEAAIPEENRIQDL